MRSARLSAGIQEPWGGLAPGTLTLLAGPAASGKTQLVLALALAAASRSNPPASALLIATDKQPPVSRLAALASGSPNLLDRVYILRVGNLVTLHHVICYHLQHLIRTKNIAFIGIDSISSLARGDADSMYTDLSDIPATNTESNHDRMHHIDETFRTLKRIAGMHGITVLCVNNISSKPDAAQSIRVSSSAVVGARSTKSIVSSDGVDESVGNRVPYRPCSFDLFAPYMNAVLFLDREPQSISTEISCIKRTLRVVYAPDVRAGLCCEFMVTERGLVPLSDMSEHD